MKTISIRELHDKTGAWVRRADEEQEIIITDRGQAVAVLRPLDQQGRKKHSWANRPLHPSYRVYYRDQPNSSVADSTIAVSEERDAWK